MIKLEIQNLKGRVLELRDESLARPLLGHFQSAGLDWMHACGAKGRCTTCKVMVVTGMDNFESLTDAEVRYRLRGQLRSNERLSCQARITGDVVVAVPPECMLPHVQYGRAESGQNNAG